MSLTNAQHQWKLSDEILPFISEKCPNGSFLVCKICSVFDVEGRRFGVVNMRNNFWLGYFKDHIKSARHKDNVLRKAMHEEAQRQCILAGERPPKRMKQSLLSFAPSNKSQKQVRDRIVGGICPTLAVEDPPNNRIIDLHRSISTINHQPLYCNGILAHKDLYNTDVQDSIISFTKLFNLRLTKMITKLTVFVAKILL